MESKGVVYIASGERYIKEAIRSVKSLRSHLEEIHVTLYTDSALESDHFNEIRIIDKTRGDYGDSILKPSQIPYDKTLFLDTDTYVDTDIENLFSLLDRFDIAAAHNPGSRTTDPENGIPAQNVPESFPLYNTGVLVLKRNPRIFELLNKWKSIYNKHVRKTESRLNQPAFREALYHSDAMIATLPPEYNCRIRYDGSAGSLTSNVKIVHGRHSVSLSTIAAKLNKYSGMRSFSYKKYPIQVDTASPSLSFYFRSLLVENQEEYTYCGRFMNSINERGIKNTARRVIREIKQSFR